VRASQCQRYFTPFAAFVVVMAFVLAWRSELVKGR